MMLQISIHKRSKLQTQKKTKKKSKYKNRTVSNVRDEKKTTEKF